MKLDIVTLMLPQRTRTVRDWMTGTPGQRGLTAVELAECVKSDAAIALQRAALRYSEVDLDNEHEYFAIVDELEQAEGAFLRAHRDTEVIL